MKLGLFTVSTPEWTPIETIEQAKEFGYDGIEWRITTDDGDRDHPTFWSGNRTSMTVDELILNSAKLRAKADKLGIKMPSLGTYISSDDELQIIEKHFIAAKELGAGSIRVSSATFDPAGNYKTQLDSAKRSYAKIAKFAEQYGVKALIETHMRQLASSACKAMLILQDLNPEHVGIMWDPGNQVMEGLEPYEMVLDITGDYLSEIHVKNMSWQVKSTDAEFTAWECVASPLRKGIVDWPVLIEVLKKRQYEGWLFFEDFSTELPLPARLQDNLQWIKALIEK